MSHTVRFTEGTLEERVGAIAKYLTELQLHRDSRRGLDGTRGPQGEPGVSNIPGPPGKDADPAQAAEIVKVLLRRDFQTLIENLESEIIAAKAALRWAVIEELKASGFVDSDGNAIPGPTGASGATVVGPKGDPGIDGKSIQSPPGRDGRDAKIVIGSVVAGDIASASLHDDGDGTFILDLVLPRGEKGETGAASTVPGPASTVPGPEGQQGIPGEGLSRQDVIDLILDMKKRGTLK